MKLHRISAVALVTAFSVVSMSRGAFAAVEGYDKCLDFSVIGYTGGSALANFPMLVRLSSAVEGFSYGDFKSSGADLRFTLEDGTELDHKIEKWNPSGTSYVWVKVPSLVNGLKLKMYYGKADDVAPDVNPFDQAGYWSVLHLGETDAEYVSAGNIYSDASGNGHTAVKAAATVSDVVYTPSSTEGIIGNAVKLTDSLAQNGKGPSVQIPQSVYTTRTFTDTFSVSGWFRYECVGQATADDVFFGCHQFRLESNWAAASTLKLMDPGCNWTSTSLGGVLPGNINNGKWYHIAATFSGTDYRVYANGALVKSGTLKAAMIREDFGFGIGNNESNNRPSFKGSVDDIRISASVIGADWIAAEYAQAKIGSKFLSIDIRKTHLVPAGTPGVVSAEPYDTWENAATDLDTAFSYAKAENADLVVRPGNYSLGASVSIPDCMVVESQNEVTGLPDAENTVIDASAVTTTYAFSVGKGAVLRGFTVKGVNAPDSQSGGALNLAGGVDSANTIIDSCIFTNNTAKYGGAILHSNTFKGVITNCQFLCNSAQRGGGLYVGTTTSAFGDRPLYVDCTFVKNVSNASWGQGPAVWGGGMVFERCTFNGNRQTDSGYTSAIYGANYTQFLGCLFRNHNSSSHGASCLYNMGISRLEGCTFTANSGNQTGGIIMGNTPSFLIDSCVFTNNTGSSVLNGISRVRNCLIADNGGAGVMPTAAGKTVIENCTIVNNGQYGVFANLAGAHAVILNSIVTGNKPASNNDWATWKECYLYATNSIVAKCTYIAGDPKACSNRWATAVGGVGFVDQANGDYHLSGKRSFACEKGLVLPWMDDTAVDLDGNPRVSGKGRPDLGCYELQYKPGGFVVIFR